jgi:phosphoribosylglycinamide formyltransferase 1
VCCSGRGSNLQAILDAVERGRVHADVAVVISDQSRAYALTRAARARIPATIIDRRACKTRASFERVLRAELDAYRIDYVVLAGFMRVLSPAFVTRYRHKIINIHPALLPAFPGAHAVRDTLRYGAQVTGVTVHFVDAGVDTGPIILQESLTIKPRETARQLLARLHKIEHKLYPTAVQWLVTGRLRVRGRTVQISR